MAPMETVWLGTLRRQIISRAKGTVLEIGAGTGINLQYYQMDQIQQLILTDRAWTQEAFQRRNPIPLVRRKAIRNTTIQCREAEVEALPFPSNQFDTVVATLLLCSVENPHKALQEIHRVLRAGGQFLFIEHVRPSTPRMAGLSDRITPAWKRIASGCHLNRDTIKTIEGSGFSFLEIQRAGDSVFVGGVAKKDPGVF